MNLICDIYVSILNFHSHYVYNVLNCTLPQTFQIFNYYLYVKFFKRYLKNASFPNGEY